MFPFSVREHGKRKIDEWKIPKHNLFHKYSKTINSAPILMVWHKLLLTHHYYQCQIKCWEYFHIADRFAKATLPQTQPFLFMLNIVLRHECGMHGMGTFSRCTQYAWVTGAVCGLDNSVTGLAWPDFNRFYSCYFYDRTKRYILQRLGKTPGSIFRFWV